jgi:hypothetical protein
MVDFGLARAVQISGGEHLTEIGGRSSAGCLSGSGPWSRSLLVWSAVDESCTSISKVAKLDDT